MRNRPDWLLELTKNVRRASRAFKTEKDWPDAWLMLGGDEDWYDCDVPLLDRPVYHSPAWLTHSGYDGEHQRIVPLWYGDVSDKGRVQREFECRLADSGDFQ